ncbi:Uncharacterised protein [uncultured Coprococcus sp.]|uniref:hypothetical protein n=1 Tax=Coprococcus ammoniilyticus TaxID=2981785 RepID=UPI0008234291|nr:hypothetical protein [Coprococcus ammoniilyticus]MCU6731149.1 hypothetical protein [Coprococcus ammoniilyticus]SCH96127.1 Uncharacterised protein [uncultured Coprococcus sp.]
MIQENEIPKYLKSTESNISKSNRKSKHKHQYEECIIRYKFSFMGKNNLYTELSSYCSICGKIGDRFSKEKSIVEEKTIHKQLPNGIKYLTHMSGKEIYEQYYNILPVFNAEFNDKYIDLNQKEND